MKIEKAECNYQVTECDLKFGEQITLDGILLIPISVLDKIRSEIERQEKWLLQAGCTTYNVDIAFDAIKSAVGKGDVK